MKIYYREKSGGIEILRCFGIEGRVEIPGMIAFITELNTNYYSLWFIRENGSDQYYRHNKGLLFDNRQKQILGQMEELEQGNSFPPVLK